MKKIQLIFILLTLVVFFSACKDDTNETISLDATSIKMVHPSHVVTGQSIIITGNGFDKVSEVILPGNIVVTNFERVGFNQISVVAPQGMTDGYIVLKSRDKEIQAPNEIHSVIPKVTRVYPDTASVGEIVTIKGENLLEIKRVIISDNIDIDALYFKRKSDVEIQVIVPENLEDGDNLIKLVTLSGSEIDAKKFVIGETGPKPPKPLLYEMYVDGFMNGWQDWGWYRDGDPDNTEFVRVGEKSYKLSVTENEGALKFGNVDLNMSEYKEIAFSVYGAPGSDGAILVLTFDWNTKLQINVVEGEWTDFAIPLDELGSPTSISEFVIQAELAGTVVYLDHVGLR